MKPKDILSIEFETYDVDGKITIKEYLKLLLCVLWDEEEGFSGKRPLGNSGWQHAIYDAMDEHGLVQLNHEAKNQLIFEAIQSL